MQRQFGPDGLAFAHEATSFVVARPEELFDANPSIWGILCKPVINAKYQMQEAIKPIAAASRALFPFILHL